MERGLGQGEDKVRQCGEATGRGPSPPQVLSRAQLRWYPLVPTVLQQGPGLHAGHQRAGTCGRSVYLMPPEGTMMQPKLPRCAQAPGPPRAEQEQEEEEGSASQRPADGVQGQRPNSRQPRSPLSTPPRLDTLSISISLGPTTTQRTSRPPTKALRPI